ncbi:MAG: hypothetical protein A2Y45_08025 [Tenericutes bacterium GWC2_34_14]|nr:MAG: hypothetical protein A2Y45_08025 [Tenericutes bacterium GWC2_34_14]OHE34824.1 MAG: hypothetical protein A2012_01635 [Tenericutes bacterium GWE2_34_108]OHE37315.1 MAG: hypothetical protein A2Y46_01375 [Tenericutes bacterium GWF1_35_14]OHE39552.1 MAG: hypothetical protein A2Y44_01485 [Tenericutes bacterium GWF2_35_184]OHE43180.1 MAG: hypothetical protein A3K26_03120 [Tenericutes bacterium RIFOXYA12_FULL_35_10]OHE44259.1 MAG: hypothetical protein A2221_04025 [Tenericutes bacterium RIFOXYA
MKKITLLLMLVFVSIFGFSLQVNAQTNYPSYTYDYWRTPLPGVSPYRVKQVVLGTSINISLPDDPETANKTLKYVEDLFVTEDHYYIVDLQSQKIIITDKSFNVEKIIRDIPEYDETDTLINTYTLVRPRGIYVTEEYIYVVDENDLTNGYVYVISHDGEFVARYGRPDNPTYNAVVFKPNKIVVDRAGRMYIVVVGAFDGIVELQRDGTFSRFVGVQPVQVNPLDLLWRSFLSREQLSTVRLFLPVEYNAMSIDNEGFIYATSSGTSSAPIQRINPKGMDVLRKNGYVDPIGDVVRMPDQVRSGLTSISVNDYGMYSVLDRSNKKIFTYNDEGYLAYVTGFEGEFEGNFLFPTAIKYDHENLVVADSTDSRTIITIFEPTAFGSLVNEASKLTYDGESIDASAVWEDILVMNSNYSLAYVGIGHAYYRERMYKEAMDAYQLGQDRENYSKAYKEYRKIRFEANFPLVATFIGLIIAFSLAYPIIKDLTKKE